MTTELYPGAAVYTISGTGPYNVGHEYTQGAIAAQVRTASAVIDLDPVDFSLSPVAGANGDLTLSSTAATTYAGAQLIIARRTIIEQGWSGTSAREKGLMVQLDRHAQALQEAQDIGGRSVRLSTGTMEPIVPGDGQTLIWNAEAETFFPGPSEETINSIPANAIAAAASAGAAAGSASSASASEAAAAGSASSAADSEAAAAGSASSAADSAGAAAGSASSAAASEAAAAASEVAAAASELSAQATAASVAADLNQKAERLTEDEQSIYPVVWLGSNGRLHAYIDGEGRITGVSFRSLNTATFGEDGPRYEPLIEGLAGDLRLGWDHGLDFGLFTEPSLALAGRIFEKQRPTILRNGQQAFLVREDGAFRHGTVAQRGGYMAEVTELKHAFSAFALIRSPAPLEICCTMGQSNAGTGGVTGENPRKQWGAIHVNALATFARIDGTAVHQTSSATEVADLSDLVDLGSWRDGPSGAGLPQNQGIMIGAGLVSAFRARGDLSPGVLGHVDWFGGQALGTFVKGQPTYENLINHHAKFVEIAARYGRTARASAVHFIQGESFSVDYQSTLNQLCTDLRTDILAATGQASPPVVLVAQINQNDDVGTPDVIPLEQLAVAAARPTEVKISAPMYQGRFAVGDTIHLDAESRFIFAEAAGDVHRRLITGEGWDTFAFTAVRTGAVITLTYKVNGMELAFDPGEGEPNGWVKPVPNQGFGYSDDSSGATISTVEIIPGAVGRLDTIRITLSTDPGAATNKLLTYARNAAGDATVDRWSGSRGMVRMRSHRSDFADMGFNIPAHVYHYAVQQEVSV